jgi:hypothetical protein
MVELEVPVSPDKIVASKEKLKISNIANVTIGYKKKLALQGYLKKSK